MPGNLFLKLGEITFFVAMHSVIVYLFKNFASTKRTPGTAENMKKLEAENNVVERVFAELHRQN